LDTRSYAPVPDLTWRPKAESGAAVSESAQPAPKAPTRLLPPEAAPVPEPARQPVPDNKGQAGPPPEDRVRPPSLPVGIPNFAPVRERIASGLKPNLDGGLDWLQANGYKAVLHIRAPGEDDAADKREVEKRGLKYLSLEMSPATLSKATLDQFNKIVGDLANAPLFAYDKDGMLAGPLWYLHFRTIDLATDEAARIKAAPLGLKEKLESDDKAVWLAIQNLLSQLEK
jgi:protein tyrosine phosphatase (PTP) superfamily phosphohydrolase (DUF442 family)